MSWLSSIAPALLSLALLTTPACADVKFRVLRQAASTSTGAQSFTIAGMGQPKAALLILSAATTSGTPLDGAAMGLGVTDCTSEYAITTQDGDNVGTAETNRKSQAAGAYIQQVGATTTDAQGNVSCITDGISINWTDAPSAAIQVHVAFWAGTDVHAKVGHFASDASIDNVVTVSSLGLTPQDVFILPSTRDTANAWNGNNAAGGRLSFCAATLVGQGCICRFGTDNVTTTAYTAGVHTAWGGVTCSGGDFPQRSLLLGGFSSANGGQFTATSKESTGSDEWAYLALSYNRTVRSWAGQVNTPAGTGVTSYTGPGWKPQGLLHALTNVRTTQTSADDTDTFENDDRSTQFAVLAADGTNSYTAGMTGDDGEVNTNTASYTYTGLHVLTVAQADLFVGTLSFSNTGWDVNYSTTGGAAAGWGYAIEQYRPKRGGLLWFTQ